MPTPPESSRFARPSSGGADVPPADEVYADATPEVHVAERTTPMPPVPPVPGESPVVSTTAPAANPPRWSGKKTAVAAALAIGLTGAGAVAAAAALPSGQTSNVGERGGFAPGSGQGGRGGQPGMQPPGMQDQQGGQGQQGGRGGFGGGPGGPGGQGQDTAPDRQGQTT